MDAGNRTFGSVFPLVCSLLNNVTARFFGKKKIVQYILLAMVVASVAMPHYAFAGIREDRKNYQQNEAGQREAQQREERRERERSEQNRQAEQRQEEQRRQEAQRDAQRRHEEGIQEERRRHERNEAEQREAKRQHEERREQERREQRRQEEQRREEHRQQEAQREAERQAHQDAERQAERRRQEERAERERNEQQKNHDRTHEEERRRAHAKWEEERAEDDRRKDAHKKGEKRRKEWKKEEEERQRRLDAERRDYDQRLEEEREYSRRLEQELRDDEARGRNEASYSQPSSGQNTGQALVRSEVARREVSTSDDMLPGHSYVISDNNDQELYRLEKNPTFPLEEYAVRTPTSAFLIRALLVRVESKKAYGIGKYALGNSPMPEKTFIAIKTTVDGKDQILLGESQPSYVIFAKDIEPLRKKHAIYRLLEGGPGERVGYIRREK